VTDEHADFHLVGVDGGDLLIEQVTRDTATLTVIGHDGHRAQILIGPDDTDALVRAITAATRLARPASPAVVDQDGRALVWRATYRRYGADYEQPCGSLRDAVGFLAGSEENGHLSATAVIGPDGEEVYRFGSGAGEVSAWEVAERLDAEEAARGEQDAASGPGELGL
jgi:hypothetical protein